MSALHPQFKVCEIIPFPRARKEPERKETPPPPKPRTSKTQPLQGKCRACNGTGNPRAEGLALELTTRVCEFCAGAGWVDLHCERCGLQGAERNREGTVLCAVHLHIEQRDEGMQP